MKLLFDQNISRKLVKLLDDVFPESQHISTVLSENAEDSQIWSFAKENAYLIVTKDDDFEQRSILFGQPPKLVWIRLGNCKTSDIEVLLRQSIDTLLAFNSDDETSFLLLP